MQEDERIYQISLTRIPDIGVILTRSLIEHFETASAVFKARKKELAAIDGIGEFRASQIKSFTDHWGSEKELSLLDQQQIRLLFITDEAYPKRLRNCADAPLLLFYKGNASLNPSRLISIVGSRNYTEYGRVVTEQLITSLLPYEVTVVSGLAYGIDAIAHKCSLLQQVPTIGVLAHGFKTIYPPAHRALAREMIHHGGLLTEFFYHELPDKHHFPKRNRIVAGLSDATIVIETAVKGGSMITADLAFQYNRDVFSVPGRLHDFKSGGCLQLIADHKAIPFLSTEQLMAVLGWGEQKRKREIQKKLFVDLSPEEKKVVSILEQHEQLLIDELFIASGLSNSSIATALLNLELQGIVTQLPGKKYQLS